MTHTPPVPAGNQSPYPLQTPPKPHTDHAPPPGDPRVAATPPAGRSPNMGLIALAAGLGLGLAAVAGGLFVASRDSGKRKNSRRKAKPRPKAKKSVA